MGKHPTDWSRVALFQAKRIDGRYIRWSVYEILSWREALREACQTLDHWKHPCRLEYITFGYYQRTIWDRHGHAIGAQIYRLIPRRSVPGLRHG